MSMRHAHVHHELNEYTATAQAANPKPNRIALIAAS